MLFRNMGLAAAAMVFFAGAALAQTTSVTGTVTGEDGKPIKDAVIKLERKDIKGNYQTKTDKRGSYFYGGLPLGTYDITCEIGGQVMDKAQNVRTHYGDPTPVEFDLRKAKAMKDAFQAAMQTGQLTPEQMRALSPEQREALEKQTKERAAAISKNKELNEAFNTAMQNIQAADGGGTPAEKLDLYTKATEALTKASTLDPKQTAVWAHMAETYVKIGKLKTGAEQEDAYNKGLEAWTKAIELSPNDASFHNNYALALAQAKKLPEAQAELQKAAELDPAGAPKYYFNLGALLVNTGQTDGAVEAFKKAIAANPDDPSSAEAHYQYGLALMGKATLTPDGKTVPPPGTKEEFEKYLQLAPNGPNAEGAKAMLQSMDVQIQTNYSNPAAKKTTKKK
jgi:tetratricopeptide (TPR) repeat protein